MCHAGGEPVDVGFGRSPCSLDDPVPHRAGVPPSAPRAAGRGPGRAPARPRRARPAAATASCQRKTSPLTTLNASFLAAGVVAAQARCRARRRASVTSVEPLVLLRRAGEDEGPPGLPADRGVDGERDAHVHGVAERVADQGVRPVHAPAEAPARRGREDLVLLGVVEVLDRQPRLLLAERRLGLGAARRPRRGRDSA